MVKGNDNHLKAIIKGLRFMMLTIILTCLTWALFGCDGKPRSEAQVEEGIKRILPSAVITSVQNRQNGEKPEICLYNMEVNGVQFVYMEYPDSDPLFGSVVTYLPSNDYCEKLFHAFSNQIKNIAQKYGVEIEAKESEMTLTNQLKSMDEIGNGLMALQETYRLLEEYIPTQNLSWFYFNIQLKTVCGQYKDLTTEIRNSTDWNFDYEKELLYFDFKDCVSQGLVENVALSTDLLQAIPTKTLNSLHINGEQYVSDKYETQFIYNLADKKYYTIVCFGTDIVYNGGVNDYLQKEIIEKYYPKANYTVDDSTRTSAYRIGTDKYRVREKRDGLIFQKNGKILDIKSFQKISDTNTGATYYYWIEVHDFAAIMGMTVDEVDDTGVYLSLSK